MTDRKTILITGVSRGFGKALALESLNRNLNVIGVARSKIGCEELIERGVKLIEADLNSPTATALIRDGLADIQQLDFLINNAGMKGTARELIEVKPEELTQLFQVHVVGSMMVTQASLEPLKKSQSPTVVFVSSRMGSISNQFDPEFAKMKSTFSYRIAKAAENMLAACVALECGFAKVLIIHPGQMKTEMGRSGAGLEPEDCAKRLFGLFDSDVKTNQIINLDGAPFAF